MGCPGCGGTDTSKCCLCSETSTKWFPWGKTRQICWRCKDKQKALLKEREEMNRKVKLLLAGLDP